MLFLWVKGAISNVSESRNYETLPSLMTWRNRCVTKKKFFSSNFDTISFSINDPDRKKVSAHYKERRQKRSKGSSKEKKKKEVKTLWNLLRLLIINTLKRWRMQDHNSFLFIFKSRQFQLNSNPWVHRMFFIVTTSPSAKSSMFHSKRCISISFLLPTSALKHVKTMMTTMMLVALCII